MSMFKRRMIVRYFRPEDEADGRRVVFTYMLAAETHSAGGFTIHLTGMNPSPAEGELLAGDMHIRDTGDVLTALLGAERGSTATMRD